MREVTLKLFEAFVFCAIAVQFFQKNRTIHGSKYFR